MEFSLRAINMTDEAPEKLFKYVCKGQKDILILADSLKEAEILLKKKLHKNKDLPRYAWTLVEVVICEKTGVWFL